MSSTPTDDAPAVQPPRDDAETLRTRRRTAFDSAWPILLGAGLGGVATATFGAAAGLAALGAGALGHSFARSSEEARLRKEFGRALQALEGSDRESVSEPPVPTEAAPAPQTDRAGDEPATAELERRLADSEAARRAQSALLAELAPEITGALRGIARITDALGETDLTLEQRDCVETIGGSTDTLIGLLGDVLDLARIEAGRMKLRRKDFHLGACVEAVTEDLYPMAWKKGLELGVEVDPSLADWYFGDERRVTQLIHQLMRGSIQTTDRGEVRLVLLPSTPTEPENGGLRIEVHDSAPVHTQAELARLIEGKPSSLESLAELDLSLGLGIARGLVEVMGGRLGAQGKGEGGNLFWLEVPLEASQEPHSALESDFSALVGVRLLVVDARTAARESLVAATERLGLIVQQAGDREQAIELLRESELEDEAIDVVLVDDDLHGGQGRDFVRDVSETFTERRPKIVLLTPSGRAQNPARLAELGIDAWVPKPVRIQRLQEALLFVSQEGNSDGETVAPEVSSAASLAPTGVRARVLLVQNEPVRARVVAAWLTRAECRVEVVERLDALPDAFADGVYDLVLLDCVAEPLDRHRVLRAVRTAGAASGPRVRIVAIHPELGDEDQRTLWLEAGADACRPTPHSLARVGSALADLLSGETSTEPTSLFTDEEMNFDPETILDLDVVQSLKELGGDDDPGLFGELVDLFLRDMPPRLEGLTEALASGDAKALEQNAHSMKSSCGNLGAMSLAELCRQIEIHGRSGDVESAQSLVEASRSEFERVCSALQQELSKG